MMTKTWLSKIHHDRERKLKFNMNLLVKDNMSRNMLSMRIKGGEHLNFLSEHSIKSKKRLQKLKSNWTSSLLSNFE